MTESILTALLANSIVFTVLFGIMLLVRKALKMSALLQYILWGVIVIKLIIPFGFESSLSPLNLLSYNIYNNAASEVKTDKITASQGDYGGLSNTTGQTGTDNNETVLPVKVKPNVLPYQGTSAAAVTKAKGLVDWKTWALYIWVFGATLVCAAICVCKASLKRRIKHSGAKAQKRLELILESCKQELGIDKRVRVFTEPFTKVPMIMGIIRPVLIMPDYTEPWDRQRIRHIFLHELTHLKHKDLIVKTLLNILNALYWFNPFVWICFKLIRRDMETVCDNAVLETIGKAGRQKYIDTVLKFALRREPEQLYTAMGMADGKVTMERRIRGMFKDTRTGVKSRAAALLIAVLMLAMCVLSACQPVQKTDALTTDNDTTATVQASVQPSDVAPSEIPKAVKENVYTKEGQYSIVFDAPVAKPDKAGYSEYSIAPADYTQEEVDSVVKYFFKDAQLYAENTAESKSDIKTLIAQGQKDLKALEDSDPNNTQEINQAKDGIKELKERYKTSPETVEKKPVTAKLTVDPETNCERLDAYADLGYPKNPEYPHSTISVINGADRYKWITVISERDRCYTSAPTIAGEQAKDQKMTKAEAKQKAEDALREMGIKDMAVESVETGIADKIAGDDPNKQGYVITFRRSADSVLIASDTYAKHNRMYTGDTIEIDIDDKGISYFEWDDKSVINEKVGPSKLLSFDKILDIARQQFISNSGWVNSDSSSGVFSFQTSHMDNINFKYTFIKDKNNPGNYLLVPEWNFYGDVTLRYANGTVMEKCGSSDNVLLSLNALDGSLIDKTGGSIQKF